MSGKALGIPVTRINKLEYESIGMEVIVEIILQNPDVRSNLISPYATKVDFGDVDIITDATNAETLFSGVALRIGCTELKVNGNVYSFGYKLSEDRIVQVDLIAVHYDAYDFAVKYYHLNELGNLMRPVARRIGLKLRPEGLYLRHGPKDNSIYILVTQDFNTMLEILGYSVEVYKDLCKFKTSLTNIFQFVITSKYINVNIFKDCRFINKEKTKDSKAHVYKAFLEYLNNVDSSLCNLLCKEIPDLIEHLNSKSLVFQRAFALHQMTVLQDKAARVFTNGNYVRQILGCVNEEDFIYVMKRVKERKLKDLAFFCYQSKRNIDEFILSLLVDKPTV